MRKNLISYIFFILAFSGFVVLRIFAGKNIESSVAETVPELNATLLESFPTVSPDDNSSENDSVENDIPVVSADFEEDAELIGILNDEYRGDFTPIKSFEGTLPRIVCWGDSLTSSFDNRTAYPDVLRTLSGCEVINYGVESENTAMIAMRQGGVRVNVKATVLPADCQMIPVFLRTENDGHVFFLEHGDGGVNPCSICGIKGTLQKINGAYYFTREQKGERISVPDGTQFKTFGISDAGTNDVLVIFTGTNDLPDSDSIYDIIKMQRSMIDAAECEKYIIIGLTYAGGIEEIDTVNEILSNEYEEHFIDIRKYMIHFGLADAQLDATDGDREDIKNGEIPRSLRRDYVHGNEHFYKLLAEQVYRRMQYLGYLPMTEEVNEGEL